MMLLNLIEKEFKQLLRNAFLPRMFLLMPLTMVLVFPYAANQEVKRLGLAVIDGDGSASSRRLTEKLKASSHFDFVGQTSDLTAADEEMKHGTVDVVLEMPAGFERDFANTGKTAVSVSINAANAMKAAMAQAYVTQIVNGYAGELIAEGHAFPSDTSHVTRASSIVPRFLFNPSLDYKNYMIPAIVAMLLVLVVGFLPTFNIVGEKERGTIEQINVSPIRPAVFIFSKLIPYWAIGLFLLGYAMLAAWVVHGLSPTGSVGVIFLFASLFVLVISALALIVSNHSSTTQAAAFLMYFFLVVFLLMSGLLTPISSMPQWAQWLTLLNPFRFFMEAMRGLYLKGCTLADLAPQLLALCAFALVFGSWALLSYRKQTK